MYIHPGRGNFSLTKQGARGTSKTTNRGVEDNQPGWVGKAHIGMAAKPLLTT